MGEDGVETVETSSVALSEKAVAPPLTEEKTGSYEATSPSNNTSTAESMDRDAVLSRIANGKRMTIIKAWEEGEKAKAENKTQKEMASITAWENSEKASAEAELRRMEEKLEKRKAEYAMKMKNKVAMIHRKAEEKRAMVEAKRSERILKAEEDAAKYRVQGQPPKKFFGCFSP